MRADEVSKHDYLARPRHIRATNGVVEMQQRRGERDDLAREEKRGRRLVFSIARARGENAPCKSPRHFYVYARDCGARARCTRALLSARDVYLDPRARDRLTAINVIPRNIYGSRRSDDRRLSSKSYLLLPDELYTR